MKSFRTFARRSIPMLMGATLLLTSALSSMAASSLPIPPAGFEDEVITNDFRPCFSDVNINTLDGRAAEYLCRNAVVGGYDDGTYRLDQDVNRAEFAKYLVLSTGIELKDVSEYANIPFDIKRDEWYARYVLAARDAGIMKGFGDGLFRPAQKINRIEAITMLSRAYNLSNNLPHSYRDIEDGSWMDQYAGIARQYGLFPDESGDVLYIAYPVDRGETARFIYLILKALENGDTTPKPSDTEFITRGEAMYHLVEEFLGGVDSDAISEVEPLKFTDIEGHQYEDHIRTAAIYDLVQDTTRFYPERNLNRAEVAKLLDEVSFMPAASQKTEPYSDVSDEHWFFEYVVKLYGHCISEDASQFFPYDNAGKDWFLDVVQKTRMLATGVDLCDGTTGNENPSPNPTPNPSQENLITRAEFAYYLVEEFLGGVDPIVVSDTQSLQIADIEGHQYEDHIRTAMVYKVISSSSTSFSPDRNVSRAEVIWAVQDLLEKPSRSGISEPYSDVSDQDWYFDFVLRLYGYCFLEEAPQLFPRDYAQKDWVLSLIRKTQMVNDGADLCDGTTSNENPDPANIAPRIVSISAPSVVEVGKSAEWKVIIKNPESEILTWKVDWNESRSRSSDIKNRSTTFTATHTYNTVGVYTPKFTVTDAAGNSATTSASVQVVSKSIPVEEGQVLFSLYSTGYDVAPDTDRHPFGTLVIENRTSENLELQEGVELSVETTIPGTEKYITDIRVETPEIGEVILGPKDIPSNGKTVIFSDKKVIPRGKTTLLITADIADGAQEGTEYKMEIDMSSIRLRGKTSGTISTGGSNGSGKYDILPEYDITTQPQTIRANTLTISPVVQPDGTLIAKQDDATVFSTRMRAKRDIVLRQVAFDQIGTSVGYNIDNCALYYQQETDLYLAETGEDIESGKLVFSQLESYNQDGILIQDGREIDLLVKCDVTSAISGQNPTLQLSLDISELDAENKEGDNIRIISSTSGDIVGGEFTLLENGTLDVEFRDSTSPETAIFVPGSKEVIGEFRFSAEHEPMHIEELTVQFEAQNTQNLFQNNVSEREELDAIKSVALLYEDGTKVKKETGSEAKAFVGNDGNALFEDLDLIIDSERDTSLMVQVEMRDGQIEYYSGSAFRARLVFDAQNGLSEVRGDESGSEIFVNDGITLDGNGNATRETEIFYFLSNRITAQKSSGQSSVISRGTRDLLKFELYNANSEEAFLEQVSVNISTNGNFGVCELRLKNGSQILDSIDAGTGKSLVGTQTFGVRNVEIDQPSDFYTIEAEIGGINSAGNCDGSDVFFGDNDDITTEININSYDPTSQRDGIVWSDANGNLIPWIDLGESDQSTTKITNTLD